jgi:RNA polymerase sigma factor (sigma-70 family)
VTTNAQTANTSTAVDVDAESLKLIAAGGRPAEAALTALFRKYRKPLLGFLIRRGVDAPTAEDLVQETFIKVAKSAGAFRRDAMASSWIYSILRNVHLDHLRKPKHEVNLDEEGWNIVEAGQEDVGADRPDQNLERRQLDDCLDTQYRAFMSEQPAAAAALQKVTEHEWSIREVAQFLGRTEAATKEYLSQCRKKLRMFFDPCRERWGARP